MTRVDGEWIIEDEKCRWNADRRRAFSDLFRLLSLIHSATLQRPLNIAYTFYPAQVRLFVSEYLYAMS